MRIQREERAEGLKVRIEGALSIYEVACCKEELLECLDGEGALEIDLGGLEECDLPGLQLLLGCRKSGLQRGKKVCFTNVPSPVRSVAENAGVPEKIFL